MKKLLFRTLFLTVFLLGNMAIMHAQSNPVNYIVNLNLADTYSGMTLKVIESGGTNYTFSIGNTKATSVHIYSTSCRLVVTDRNGLSDSYMLDLDFQGEKTNNGMNLEATLAIKYIGGRPHISLVGSGNTTPPSGNGGGADHDSSFD